MINPAYIRTMAAYNAWQNRSLSNAADTLGEVHRRLPRGAFFSSILGTFSHLMWADQVWMHRFDGWARPSGGIKESQHLYPDWAALRELREQTDYRIAAWAEKVDQSWLSQELSWLSGSTGTQVSRPRALLVTHFFNHQTHHRGQIHAMLTTAGAEPDATDLFLMPGADGLIDQS
jgi:uncharacterized damage-inducible protein DinB